MALVTTLDEMYLPLIDAPTLKLPYCAVCGRSWPLNFHHLVWRGWGQVVRNGKVLDSPMISLCGNGSHLGASGSAEYCHGKAHHRMLHFRNDRGRLEFIELEMPTNYLDALEMEGWEPLATRFWE